MLTTKKFLKNKFFLEIIVVYIIFLSLDCLIVVQNKKISSSDAYNDFQK
jgi:hypothetical protein